MTAFATTDDLAARLGLTLTVDEQTRAEKLLELASTLIQDETGQTISLVTDDTLTTRGTTDERIKLPERPVVSIASVTLDGTPLVEGTDWYLDGNEIVSMSGDIVELNVFGVADPAVFPLGSGFGTPDETLVIVYSHGYTAETVPGTAKAICIEAAARVWVNPGSVREESYGSSQVTYQAGNGLILTETERRTLRRKFGRRAVSVQILGG